MQVNVDLPEDDAKRIKKDSIEMGVTLNAYVLEACRRFLGAKIAQRRVHFEDKKHRKILGRRVLVVAFVVSALLHLYQVRVNYVAVSEVYELSHQIDLSHTSKVALR